MVPNSNGRKPLTTTTATLRSTERVCQTDWQDVIQHWHHCHCRAVCRMRHAEHMGAYSSSASGQRASWIVRSARQVHHVLSEINEANKRATMMRLAYGVAESDRAPDTYAEFLFRSRIVTVHEPSAHRRGAGRPVR